MAIASEAPDTGGLWTARARTVTRVPRQLLKARYIFGGILALVAVTAIFAPLIAPYDPNAIDIINRLAPPAWSHGGTASHLLGTDELGWSLRSG